jgi:hypothetical protein
VACELGHSAPNRCAASTYVTPPDADPVQERLPGRVRPIELSNGNCAKTLRKSTDTIAGSFEIRYTFGYCSLVHT